MQNISHKMERVGTFLAFPNSRHLTTSLDVREVRPSSTAPTEQKEAAIWYVP
jgi:hypothetical protein